MSNKNILTAARNAAAEAWRYAGHAGIAEKILRGDDDYCVGVRSARLAINHERARLEAEIARLREENEELRAVAKNVERSVTAVFSILANGETDAGK